MATNDSWTLVALREFINEAGDFFPPGWPDVLVNNWINSAIQAWADWVLEQDDTRFMSEGTIAIVSGTDSYDLKDGAILSADDFYRARGLAVADSASSSGYSRIHRSQFSQRHDYNYSSTKLLAKWDIIGDTLTIWPKPTWSADALLEYVPLPAKLAGDSDTVDLRGNVDFIVTWVCMRCAPRDESSRKDWTALNDAAKLAIRQASPQLIGEVKRAVSRTPSNRRRYRGIPRQRT